MASTTKTTVTKTTMKMTTIATTITTEITTETTASINVDTKVKWSAHGEPDIMTRDVRVSMALIEPASTNYF